MLEAHLEDHVRLYALYLQLDLVEPCIDAHREVQQIGKLYQDRDVGPEVLDLQVDPVDLEIGDVQKHVWLSDFWLLAVWLLAVWLLAVRWPMPAPPERARGHSHRQRPEGYPSQGRCHSPQIHLRS